VPAVRISLASNNSAGHSSVTFTATTGQVDTATDVGIVAMLRNTNLESDNVTINPP
jgi:hypothetical protein